MKKKNYLVIVLIVFVAICGIMNLTPKTKTKTFTIVTDDLRQSSSDWREYYADYGEIAVNWYYSWQDNIEDEPKYEVISKRDGKSHWMKRTDIFRMIRIMDK